MSASISFAKRLTRAAAVSIVPKMFGSVRITMKRKRMIRMFDTLQLIGGLILALGYLPQIRQIIRTKSCKDLNLKTYLLVFGGIALMEAYAVNLTLHGTGAMFLVTNSLSLAVTGTMCVMIIAYRKAGKCVRDWKANPLRRSVKKQKGTSE